MISVKHLSKKFGDVTVLKDISLDIKEKEVVVIIGPSGSGKSTILRCLNHLETPSGGEIVIDGIKLEEGANLNAIRREVGMVFQRFNLFPNMTVLQNIMLAPMQVRGKSKEEAKEKAMRLLKRVGLEHKADAMPDELSGGQQQRVAIARTLAPEPAVLFMDEPLSNLDAKLRLEMRYELQRLHVETGSTFVYVTHDQMEAMTLATKICLINNGVLQQYDAPLDVYNRPANLFVADFVGNPSINFVEAKGKEQADGSFRFKILDDLEATFRPNEPIDMAAWFAKRDKDAADLEAQRIEMLKDKKAVEKSNKDEVFKYHIAKVDESDYAVEEEPEITNEDFVLAIRPEALKLSKDGSIASTIYGAMPTGMESTVKLRIGKYLLTGVIFGGVTFKLGEETGVDIAGTDILLFDRKSGKAITAGSLAVKG